jgi:hypothetical protein
VRKSKEFDIKILVKNSPKNFNPVMAIFSQEIFAGERRKKIFWCIVKTGCGIRQNKKNGNLQPLPAIQTTKLLNSALFHSCSSPTLRKHTENSPTLIAS